MENLNSILERIQKRNTLFVKGEYFFSVLKENPKYLAYIGYIFVDKKALIPIGESDYIDVYDKEKDTFTKMLIDLTSLKDIEIPKEFAIKDDYTVL